MLRFEFKIRLAGILSHSLDVSEQVESIEIGNALPVTNGRVFLFLTIRFEDTVSETSIAGQLPNIDVVTVSQATVSSQMYYLCVVTELANVPVLSLLTEQQAIPHRIVSEDSRLSVVASVRDWNHLKTVATTIEDEHGSLELVATTQTESIGFPLGGNKIRQNMSGKLSDAQLEVLEMAYQMGYFKVPQEVTAEEIANELDISRSTLSERLRRVEDNFCALLFGPRQ
jgi:predicted DNA binding protein